MKLEGHLTLSDPMDHSLPGSSIHGIFQARVLEWGAIAFSDTTEWLHFHLSLSLIGEGNGNPLQCSCLENPRDGRAWWAAIYGITQSQTQLKWLSSSRSSSRRPSVKVLHPEVIFNIINRCTQVLKLSQKSMTSPRLVKPPPDWWTQLSAESALKRHTDVAGRARE